MSFQLQITYEKNIEKYFLDYEFLRAKIGKDKTKSVKNRINHLVASDNFFIFLSLKLGNPHRLSGKMDNYYAVNITANFRLILQPISKDFSPEALKECTCVIVKGVDDYHDGKDNWIIP